MKVLSMSLDQLVGLAEMHNGWSKGKTSILQLLALFLHIAQLFFLLDFKFDVTVLPVFSSYKNFLGLVNVQLLRTQ